MYLLCDAQPNRFKKTVFKILAVQTKKYKQQKKENSICALHEMYLTLGDCLQEFLIRENKYRITEPYFDTVQTEISPYERSLIVRWMFVLCEEGNCPKKVVLLAVNYMDRYLSTRSIPLRLLQLLGSACFLIAAKILDKKSYGITPAYLMSFIMDNKLDKNHLLEFEFIIVNVLKWKLSAVVSLDFLDSLIMHLPLRYHDLPYIPFLMRTASKLTTLTALDATFLLYTASTIATSSLVLTWMIFSWVYCTRTISKIIEEFSCIICVDKFIIWECLSEILLLIS